MTKVTNIQNKNELLNLTTKLSDELVTIQGEINSIKTKLGSVSNYDGLNFEGAASVISSNLTNVLTAMETLSGNVTSYVTSLNEFDQYEEPMVDDELTAPEMTPPEETITPPADENPIEDTKPEDDVPVVTPTPSTSETEKPSEEQNPEEKTEEEEPTPQPKPQPKPQPQPQPTPTPSPSPSPQPTPEFVPEQLSASEAIIIQDGDVNVDISKFTNNEELGYTVTVGNTSYILGENDFDLLCAIIEAESDGTYDGTLAVATTILNRCENADYQKMYGLDPIAQITAANQFEGYTSGEFKKYLNNNSDIVIDAVKSALAGVRNHKLCTLGN